MKNFYSLQIKFESSFETYRSISKILELEPTEIIPFTETELKNGPVLWQHEIKKTASDPYFDFISYYSDLLFDKYDELAKLGIEREAISVWLLYAYNGQCNLEFDPLRLKKLGDNGITFCISCWEED